MDSTGIVPTMPIGNDGFSGGSGIWLFAILALMWGGNGLFGNRGYGLGNEANNINEHTTMVSAFNELQEENGNIINTIQRTTSEINQNLYNASYNNLNEVKTLESNVAEGFGKMQECCCSTLRAIDSVNYNGALNTASINANTTAQTQKILDALAQNKIDALQSQVNQLQLAQATSNIVRWPNAYTVPAANPFYMGGNFTNNI